MKRQTLIALAVAIFLGLIAVFLANSFLSGAQQRRDAEALTRVAVAAIPMGYGTELTVDKVRFVNYPKSSLPPGSFANVAQLFPDGEKRIALLPIATNEPILQNKISG